MSPVGVQYRLTQPRRPDTNGMVERHNGPLPALIADHDLTRADDLHATLKRYVWLYNHHIRQKALNHRTQVQDLKDSEAERPNSYLSKSHELAGDPTGRRPYHLPCAQ